MGGGEEVRATPLIPLSATPSSLLHPHIHAQRPKSIYAHDLLYSRHTKNTISQIVS